MDTDAESSSIVSVKQEGIENEASTSSVTNVAGGTWDGAQYSNSPNCTVTEKLNHELAMSNLHRLQLQTNWRQVLVKEKFHELRDEIPRLIKYHDENVEWKRQVIDSYHTGIRNLQQLHHDATVTHRNRIEELITIHNQQVAKLEHDFSARASSLRSQSNAHLERINSQYNQEKDVIRQFLKYHEEKGVAEVQALHQKHQHELDTLKRRNIDQINDVRSIFDQKVKEMEDRLQRIRDEFAENTDGTRTAYAQLKAKDDALRKDVASKMKHASTLQRERQRSQLISMQEEAQIQETHEELLARKSRAITKLNLMQAEMKRFREDKQTR